jgi:Holliday junction resolvase RusA-like endonuclease
MAVMERFSVGSKFVNEGLESVIDETTPYQIDFSRRFYLFDIVPVSAPRMTQSDRWKTNPNHHDPKKRQRPAVNKYFNYKNTLLAQAKEMGFTMKSVLDVVFIVPMPTSWSEKKKGKQNGLPCKSKPDTDNYVKALKDTFCENDSHIWREKAEKRWGYKGSVLVYF